MIANAARRWSSRSSIPEFVEAIAARRSKLGLVFAPCRASPRHIAMMLMAALAVTRTYASLPPTLLVLPLDMVDTSGETPPRSAEREQRLKALDSYLSKALMDEHIYTIVDPTAINAAIGTARSAQRLAACNGCERDLGRSIHADRVLVGRIDKISTLIGNLTLRISDVETGQIVFARTVSFRGDTDEAWQRAARFLIRDLGTAVTQKP